MFPEDNEFNETPMFMGKCKKISRWNISQDRVLILSTHFIYLLNNNEMRKSQGISKLKYIVKSSTTMEILLYFTDETDLRLQLDKNDTDMFLQILKLRFANLCPKVNLKVFGVPQDSLKEFRSMNVANGGNAYAFDNEPADIYRLKDEEIMTQKEYEQANNLLDDTDPSIVDQN
jgi:hypothetical protein